MSAPAAVTAEKLFEEAFLPLYPEDAARDLKTARRVDANPGQNPNIEEHLREAAQIFAAMAPEALGSAVDLDFTDASVHRLTPLLSAKARDRWRTEDAHGTARGTLFNFVVHGAAYVGECARRGRDARWLVRRPLWESLVELRSAAGVAELAPFHFWLKALSDDALEGRVASLGDRYRTHVETPTLDAFAMPVFLPTERRLPRLTKVRYDALYKYMRAHLPEIRDLGRDFPSPERFEDMGLRWVDAHILGGGRLALLAAAGRGGVHLFWLDGAGFTKGAFVAGDDFPEPVVDVRGERIVVMTRDGAQDAVSEMLWWGP